MNKEPKKIEVITGDGKNLNISDVSTHIPSLKPKTKNGDDKQEVVIPKAKKGCSKKNNKK